MENETRVFKKNKLKSIFLFLLSLIFVFGGILLLKKEPLTAWFGIIFFGLGGLASLSQFIPNAYYLKLDEKGFEVKTLYRIEFTHWSEVKDFRIGSIRGNKMIFFDYTKKHTKWKYGKKIAKFLSGKEGAIPSNYNIKTKELLDLMKEYKRGKSL